MRILPARLARRLVARWRALRRRLMPVAIALAPRAVLCCGRLDGRELGLVGEEFAARALADAGWRLIGRRVATPAGEVDLVARRGDLLAAVEVKTCRGPHLPRDAQAADRAWRPAARVDAERLARQRQAARWLAACHGIRASRVDLLEVWVRGARVRCVHLANIEQPLPAREPSADRAWLPGAPGQCPGS